MLSAETAIGSGNVDNTDFDYLNGVTSAIQTQFTGKANTAHSHGDSEITAGVNATKIGGGTVDKVGMWGKRRMQYEIKKKADGFYAVIELAAEPAIVKELDRQLNLNEGVLRTKVLRPEHR